MYISDALPGRVCGIRRLRFRIPLSELRPGEVGQVIAIDPSSSLRERLGDLGILPGRRLRCELISLFGDPVAYRILSAGCVPGTVIALRRRDAAALTMWVARPVRLRARRDII